MNFTDSQETAMKLIKRWLGTSDKRFVLGGYAGTGKSTIAAHLADIVGDSMIYLAYTGKAASVLRGKGCNASTIHSVIYTVIGEDVQGEPVFGLNIESIVKNYMLVVVDEYSMLPQKIIDDLEKLSRKVLYLGDPFQLPPILGKCILEPDTILTEVHRQALDSNILRIATDIRLGKKIEHCRYDDFIFDHKRNIDKAEFLKADKIIVGYNKTRREWNTRYRQHIGYEGNPRNGDVVICLQNNHEKGLYNGMTGKIIECENYKWFYQMCIDTENGIKNIKCFSGIFEGHDVKKYIPDIEKFDYGYVLSCHKSQGSEWDSVVVYNEPVGQGIDRQKWLYTALTRAKTKLILADR